MTHQLIKNLALQNNVTEYVFDITDAFVNSDDLNELFPESDFYFMKHRGDMVNGQYIIANEYEFNAQFSAELEQDLKCIYSINFEEEITKIMLPELIAEYKIIIEGAKQNNQIVCPYIFAFSIRETKPELLQINNRFITSYGLYNTNEH